MHNNSGPLLEAMLRCKKETGKSLWNHPLQLTYTPKQILGNNK